MKVKNISKGLIVLTVLAGGIRKAIEIPAGETVENEHIKDTDIAVYVAEKSLKDLSASKAGEDLEKKNSLVVLPDNPTAETLDKMGGDDLKTWCKQEKLTKYSSLNKSKVIEMILNHLKDTKPPADEENKEGKGEA